MIDIDIKKYGIYDLSKEPFEIKEIFTTYENYGYKDNIKKIKRYIIIDKRTNKQVQMNWEYKSYRTFKKALLAILRYMGRIDNVEHNKCEKFYNYEQDEESFYNYYKERNSHVYSSWDEKINPEYFLSLLKFYNGHMSKAIRKYLRNMDSDVDFRQLRNNDYETVTDSLIYEQIPKRYYKDEHFINNIPRYAKLLSREFYYTKKGEEHYGEEITDSMRKSFDDDAEMYEILMYQEVNDYMDK